ncbi:MAG: ABC transporter substrate-binding protein, partial [Acidimicrobiales bacterium]
TILAHPQRAQTDLPLDDLNPHRSVEAEPLISRHVLPTMVVVEEDFSLTPSLAAELPTLVSSDPQIVAWRLRDDAVWDDGTPITANDVKRTWEFITDPDSGSIGTAFYERISDFAIQDDQNFTITFSEPVAPYGLMFSTNHPVIKAAALDQYLASGGTAASFLSDLTSMNFSGGPYRVSGFDSGNRVTLVRNEAWWGIPPNLEQINARSYTNSDDLLQALEAKDVDLAYLQNPGATDGQTARQIPDVD